VSGSQVNGSTTVTTQSTVPEPASLLLLASGLGFVAQRMRKRRK
jgi:hypothetical protein